MRFAMSRNFSIDLESTLGPRMQTKGRHLLVSLRKHYLSEAVGEGTN